MLTKIGESVYGTKYALNGVIPFQGFDIQALEWGDVIQDNNGKGMIMYVNQCCTCQKKYLMGLLIMVPEECKSCYFSALRSNYSDDET